MPKGQYTRKPGLWAKTPEQKLALFWAKVDPCRTDGCAIWLASKTRDGYGYFKFDGKMGRAHHFLVGLPPKGMEWDHRCRNRDCVWPDCLELVTHAENMARAKEFWPVRPRATHCPRGHAYTEENTYRQSKPNGGYTQVCRTCRYAQGVEWRKAHA